MTARVPADDARPHHSQLETFPNPRPGRRYVNEIVCPEWTSMCPKTGHPDFGVVTYSYIAGDACVELKSLKLYLHRFRNEGAFYEEICNRLLDDFVAACSPLECTVRMDLTPRGGLRSTITCTYQASKE